MRYFFSLRCLLGSMPNLATALFYGAGGALLVAKPHATPAEYRQTATGYYLAADVLKSDPHAVIVQEGELKHSGDSYILSTHRKPPEQIYLEQVRDWMEPITPPSMPANLNIALDEMQVREPNGDVQVALPSAPGTFNPATEGMVLPSGTFLKTGADGSMAVLFGGVDSVRVGPNTQAAVKLLLTSTSRSAEVDLQAGIAFSKVGQRAGEREVYEVHTPFGNAMAHGTDFATVLLSDRVDIWVAEGNVELAGPDGKKVDVASSGKVQLKVMRLPAAKDGATAMQESSDTLTALLTFLSTSNRKLQALHDKITGGAKATALERRYLARLRKVPALIKLAYVPPPSPAPIVSSPPATVSTAPAVPPAETNAAPTPSPAPTLGVSASGAPAPVSNATSTDTSNVTNAGLATPPTETNASVVTPAASTNSTSAAGPGSSSRLAQGTTPDPSSVAMKVAAPKPSLRTADANKPKVKSRKSRSMLPEDGTSSASAEPIAHGPDDTIP